PWRWSSVWGCCSYDCKLDVIIVPGTLNGQRYHTLILNADVMPQFDNHAPATLPFSMDDKASHILLELLFSISNTTPYQRRGL
ncbi:hypothetical protein ScPMuIL_004050, partial [Solemya velum]